MIYHIEKELKVNQKLPVCYFKVIVGNYHTNRLSKSAFSPQGCYLGRPFSQSISFSSTILHKLLRRIKLEILPPTLAIETKHLAVLRNQSILAFLSLYLYKLYHCIFVFFLLLLYEKISFVFVFVVVSDLIFSRHYRHTWDPTSRCQANYWSRNEK